MPVDRLSHILYAFGDLSSDGSVILSDKWADQDIHYANDSWNDQGKNLYGNFKQMYLLKKQHRHLKTLLRYVARCMCINSLMLTCAIP